MNKTVWHGEMGDAEERIPLDDHEPPRTAPPAYESFFDQPEPYLITAQNLLRRRGQRHEARILERAHHELRLGKREHLIRPAMSTVVENPYVLALILPSAQYPDEVHKRENYEERIFAVLQDALRAQKHTDKPGQRSYLQGVSICVYDDVKQSSRSDVQGLARRTWAMILSGLEELGHATLSFVQWVIQSLSRR